jgi:hypothetical protein
MAPKKAAVALEKVEGGEAPAAVDSQVIKRLHQILKNADLEKTTVKNIQKQLEADLNIVLSDRKQFIRDEVRKQEVAGSIPAAAIPYDLLEKRQDPPPPLNGEAEGQWHFVYSAPIQKIFVGTNY